MNAILHPKTLLVIARVINGDDAIWMDHPVSPWREDEEIRAFFRDKFGITNLPGVEDSREKRTAAWLSSLNGTEILVRIVEESVNPHHYAHSQFDAERAVGLLDESLKVDGYRLIRHGKGYVLREHGKHVNVDDIPTDILTNDYILEISNKCTSRLDANDLDGAITMSRTLIEAVLVELEHRLARTRSDFGGDLQKRYKHVMRMMHLDDENVNLDENLKQVMRGFVTVVNGLAGLRNMISDSHAREFKPAPHHARVVVNAAKTVADFLVRSYSFQHEKGRRS